MASNKFEGGKCHGGGDVKAALRHNDTSPERRAIAAKENKHIDVTRAGLNVNLTGDTYEERCARYDARIAELDAQPGANKRKDRVTGQLIETPVPAGLPRERYNAFLRRVLEIQKAQYGAENLIAADIHWDEEHEYRDAETGEPRTSRVHLQAVWVPVKDGRLYGQAMYSRAGMRQLNAACQKMAAAEFGVDFMDGSGRRSKKSVRELKAESAAAAIMVKADQEREAARVDREAVASSKARIKAKEAAAAADRAKAAQELRAAQEARQRAEKAEDEARAVLERLNGLAVTQAEYDQGFLDYVVSPKSGRTVGAYLAHWQQDYERAQRAKVAAAQPKPKPKPAHQGEAAPREPVQEPAGAARIPAAAREAMKTKARAERVQERARAARSIWDTLDELPELDPTRFKEI